MRDSVTGRMLCQGGVKALRAADLPGEGHCAQCDETKPRDSMVVVHTKADGVYYMRPRCKDCHNKKERGHRRDWKRNYLKRWRSKNKELDESYWKDNPIVREQKRIRMAKRIKEHGDAIAIQRRFRARGYKVSFSEAQELLAKYGRCYPTRFGLTRAGLRECERIRSRQRAIARRNNRHRLMTAFDIRVAVYEDGRNEDGERFFIPPKKQPIPYLAAAENMRRFRHAQLNAAKGSAKAA